MKILSVVLVLIAIPCVLGGADSTVPTDIPIANEAEEALSDEVPSNGAPAEDSANNCPPCLCARSLDDDEEDIDAVENALKAHPEIGVVCFETIQGGGGINTAPAAFWQKLRALCDAHDVLWVADEVQCGVGRTGRFYAFEHYGVVPDVTAVAKSLGGGKAAMAAMIAKRDVYMKAYGTPKTALIHAAATFGGIGEGCITAIETIDTLYEEDLINNAAETGAYLKSELKRLQEKYPKIIKDVRGQGCMIGLEFQDFSQTLPAVLRPAVAVLDDKLKGSLSGFVGALLLRDYDVLVAFTEYNRNVVRLLPPLILERAHVDQLVTALDELLGRGVVAIVKDFIASQVK